MTIIGDTPVARAARADVERQDAYEAAKQANAAIVKRDRELTNRIAALTAENLQLREETAKRLEHVKRLTRERDQLTAVLDFVHNSSRPDSRQLLLPLIERLASIHKLTAAFAESGA